MAGIVGNCWTWLYMDRNGQNEATGNLRKWIKMDGKAVNGCKWLEIARNGQTWLEMAGYVWNGWLKTTGSDWKWPKMAEIAGSG